MTKSEKQSLYDLIVLAVSEAHNAGKDHIPIPLARINSIKKILLPGQAEDGLPKSEYEMFNAWLAVNAPNLLRMKSPISEAEHARISEWEDKKLILKVIEAMNNHAPLTKKYVSAYSTLKNWYSRDINSTTYAKQISHNQEGTSSVDRARAIIAGANSR